MEKYNEISAGGCEFDAYGNQLQDASAQTFPTEMFHQNDFHYNSTPNAAPNGAFYQFNNHQRRNDMLNHLQPIPQHLQQQHHQHRQQPIVGDIYDEQPQQRNQGQTSFLGTCRGVVSHLEIGQQQKPHLTAHYVSARAEGTSLRIAERQSRLIRAQNTQQLQRSPNTMVLDRDRQIKPQHHELNYHQQQPYQCYPNQASDFEAQHSDFSSFSAGNFPDAQQVLVDGYANATNAYRRYDNVNPVTNDLTGTIVDSSLIAESTSTIPLYERQQQQQQQQQQQILYGHEQTHPFAANNSNECCNYSMLPPPPPPSLTDEGDLTGGQVAHSYYSSCEFVDGEPVNRTGLQIGHQEQVAQSSDGSLSTDLNSEQILNSEKGVYVTSGVDGGSSSELSRLHALGQYNFLYQTASHQEQLEETTNQLTVVKSGDPLMDHRLNLSRSVDDIRATSQQDYIDMRSCGNLSQDWLDTICRHMIEHMESFGICVIDNFLGSIKGELILDEVKKLFSNRSYSTGRLVSDKLDSSLSAPRASNDPAKTIRNDRVIWVDGCEEGCEEINNLIQTLCSVVTNSSRLSLYSRNGLDKVVIRKRTKAHVACYPGQGTRYIKHVDNPNGDGRVITAIYYLNKSWSTKQHGGLLRMFPAGVETVANIEPLFDRVLFFWSDRRNPHEVLPAYRDRYAITVWYIGDNRSQET